MAVEGGTFRFGADGGGAGAAGRTQFVFVVEGTLVVATDVAARLQPSGNVTLNEVRILVKVAPVGQSIIVDVLRNGTTIFNTKPEIAAGTKEATSTDLSITNLVKDDDLTVNVDQVGTTTAGDDLSVLVRGNQS